MASETVWEGSNFCQDLRRLREGEGDVMTTGGDFGGLSGVFFFMVKLYPLAMASMLSRSILEGKNYHYLQDNIFATVLHKFYMILRMTKMSERRSEDSINCFCCVCVCCMSTSDFSN